MTAAARRVIFSAEPRLSLTQADGSPVVLTGYAIVWGAVSSDRGGYKVRLLPDSAKFASTSHALWHHEYRDVLADTDSGTLRITPDTFGVKVEIDLPDTGAGRDVAELVRTRRVRGMSFGMVDAPKGTEVKEGGQTILNVESFLADEVTITAIPAFKETSIGLRPAAPVAVPAYARAAQACELERFRFATLTLPSSRESR